MQTQWSSKHYGNKGFRKLWFPNYQTNFNNKEPADQCSCKSSRR
nr:MAG TPA: hypothetical protein [Caudoviricetes sp.]